MELCSTSPPSVSCLSTGRRGCAERSKRYHCYLMPRSPLRMFKGGILRVGGGGGGVQYVCLCGGRGLISCLSRYTENSLPPFTVQLVLLDYKGSAYMGRLHSRTAILIPPPQDREQVPKGLHTPQAPSTGVASCSLVMHRPCLQCCIE